MFVGANNSGKTSILQGIGALLKLNTIEPSRHLAYRLNKTGNLSVSVELLLEHQEWKSFIELVQPRFPNSSRFLYNDSLYARLLSTPVPVVIDNFLRDGITINSNENLSPTFTPDYLVEKTGLSIEDCRQWQSLVHNITYSRSYFFLGNPIFFSSMNIVDSSEAFRSEEQVMAEHYASGNIRGKLFYLKQNNPEEFESIKRSILAIFPEIIDFTVELNLKKGVFEFLLSENVALNGHSINVQYDASDVGLGMQNLLVFIANILLLKPSVVLMDEPDVHMHPALVRDFVRILKQLSKQTQFFITTHNIAFIDALAPEDIFTVVYRPEEKGSLIRSVAERIDAVEAAEMLGFSVSNGILSGKPKVYAFVEGKSDEKYLLHFAKRLGYAKSVNAFTVQFVPMGGKGERFKMLSLVEKLGMTETPLVMVLDRDETSEEEIQKLRERYFRQHPERLLYWSRRQIENYLCVPSAIQKLLQTRMDTSMYAAQVQDLNVDALFQELADKQQRSVLKRYLEHNVINFSIVRTEKVRGFLEELDISLPSNEYGRKLANKLTGMIAEQLMIFGEHSASVKTTFLEQWNNPEQRLALCDGRQLLSDLRKDFQQRGWFSSFSDDEIIAYCEPDDIHIDIRGLLSQLHSMTLAI